MKPQGAAVPYYAKIQFMFSRGKTAMQALRVRLKWFIGMHFDHEGAMNCNVLVSLARCSQ